MFRKLALLAFVIFITFPVMAKNTVNIPVSCVIPRTIILTEKSKESSPDSKLEEKAPEDILIQFKEKKRKKKRVIIKTVLLK